MFFNRLQQIIAERRAANSEEQATEDNTAVVEDRTRGDARREAREERK